jgi:hypothetical protein
VVVERCIVLGWQFGFPVLTWADWGMVVKMRRDLPQAQFLAPQVGCPVALLAAGLCWIKTDKLQRRTMRAG